MNKIITGSAGEVLLTDEEEAATKSKNGLRRVVKTRRGISMRS